MHFRRVKLPESLVELGPAAREQLAIAGRTHDGTQTDVDVRYRARSGESGVERWEVIDDDGEVRYEMWWIGGDSGTIFFAHEARVVGHIERPIGGRSTKGRSTRNMRLDVAKSKQVDFVENWGPPEQRLVAKWGDEVRLVPPG